jgi:hypothetical protein
MMSALSRAPSTAWSTEMPTLAACKDGGVVDAVPKVADRVAGAALSRRLPFAS